MSSIFDCFEAANRQSPIVYYSVDGRTVTIRLSDNSVWHFQRRQLRLIERFRFADLAVA